MLRSSRYGSSRIASPMADDGVLLTFLSDGHDSLSIC
jgi:hypothetical protein